MIIKHFHLKRGERPYIKKIENIGKIKVWLVDSQFIRKSICEDFVNCGEHYIFMFIPKNEFWIAKETVPDEHKFYIEYLLAEHRLMKKGIKKEIVFEKASLAEKKERKKSEKMKKYSQIKNHEKLVKKVHKKLLKIYHKNLKIWLIRGELVRDFFDIDFAGGGHDKVYNYIPKNEIWLDDDISQKERKFILLHELHERFWMSKGLEYHPAHRRATKIEDLYRHNPKNTILAIKRELKRQN